MGPLSNSKFSPPPPTHPNPSGPGLLPAGGASPLPGLSPNLSWQGLFIDGRAAHLETGAGPGPAPGARLAKQAGYKQGKGVGWG